MLTDNRHIEAYITTVYAYMIICCVPYFIFISSNGTGPLMLFSMTGVYEYHSKLFNVIIVFTYFKVSQLNLYLIERQFRLFWTA